MRARACADYGNWPQAIRINMSRTISATANSSGGQLDVSLEFMILQLEARAIQSCISYLSQLAQAATRPTSANLRARVELQPVRTIRSDTTNNLKVSNAETLKQIASKQYHIDRKTKIV